MQHTNRTAGWLSYKSTPYRDRTFSELRSAKLESTLAQAWPSYTYQPFRNGLISRSSRQKLHFPPTTLINVRLNMIGTVDRKALSLPKHKPNLPNGHQARHTAETVLRTRPQIYRKIVHLLADPYWSVLQISKNCRVSEHTVRAIREREAQDIAERKKSLSAILVNVAELGANPHGADVGKASLRDAVMATEGSNPSLTDSWVNRHQDAKSKNNP